MLVKIIRLALLLCPLNGLLLAQPSLRIISPAGGATVHPGESVIVTVDVSPQSAFEIVLVNAPTPLGKGKQVLKAPPYQFTIEVPRDTRPDKYAITALGITPAKQFIYSNPVEILVERSDLPVSMSVYPVVADFTMDQKRYLQVTGTYADMTTADLTQSSRIKYASDAPAVATVSPQGIVTPVSPGSTKLVITYGNLKLEVPVRVHRAAQ